MLLKPLQLKRSGNLEADDIRYLGGKYSLLERIKKGGIGSTKVLYESGIQAFDALDNGVANESSFVNFELMRNGLVFRLNRTQRLRCLGIRLSDIEAIHLIAYRIEIKVRGAKKIVHRGELEIVDREGESSSFRVVARNFKGILKFFGKEEFAGKFFYTLSDNPPEKDLGSLTGLLDGLL
jgi:hypothetical protein